MMTFNDEVAVSTEFPFEHTCAVVAAPLVATLNKFTGDEVDLDLVDNQLIVKCGKKKVKLPVQAEITLPEIAVPENFVTAHPDFGSALSLTHHSCGKDQSKYMLCCVHVTPDYVEACDGFQATRYSVKTGVDTPILIPQMSAKILGNANITEISVDKQWFHAKLEDTVYSTRLYEMDYPSLDGFMSMSGKEIVFPNMNSALSSAAIFTDQETKSIQVLVENGVVNVKSSNNMGMFEEEVAEIDFPDKVEMRVNANFLKTLLGHGNTVQVTTNALVVKNEWYTHVAALVI